jgi:hypothetical protein
VYVCLCERDHPISLTPFNTILNGIICAIKIRGEERKKSIEEINFFQN